MAIFFISTSYPDVVERLGGKIAEILPDDYYEIDNDKWLVSFKGTSRVLYKKLSQGEPASENLYFMFRTSGYYGMAPADMWEWILSKSEATNA